MPRRPLTAVEVEAWGLLGRELHSFDGRSWCEFQARLRAAFEAPVTRTAESYPLDHLAEDASLRFQGVLL